MTLRHSATAQERQAIFWEKLHKQGFVRLLEAHNGLSALVAQTTRVQRDSGPVEFDGIWISSLTDSAARGLPDAEIVGNGERLDRLQEICGVTDKPVVVDGDTGGSPEQFEYFARNLDRLGASAVVIEDKRMPKRNSLDQSGTDHHLEDPFLFAQKITRGKAAIKGSRMMIIARLESLIAGASLEDALLRARRYAQAGADGILVHSKSRDPGEVLAFAERYEAACKSLERKPYLACVPTTYNLAMDGELVKNGFNIIIHANHQLRAAHQAMTKVAQSILAHDRSFEASAMCSPLSELFGTVGYDEISKKEKEVVTRRLPLIISAESADGNASAQAPRALLMVGEQPMLGHQIDSARRVGFSEVAVVTGFGAETVRTAVAGKKARFFETQRTHPPHNAESFFTAEALMEEGFAYLYSDVLVAPEVLRRMLETSGQIVIAVDRVHDAGGSKRLVEEVVLASRASPGRRLQVASSMPVVRIGRTESAQAGAYEFSGIACCTRAGAQILKKVYSDSRERHTGAFHQAPSVAEATFTDLLQEYIDLGFEVRAVEISNGWMHVRTKEDLAQASAQLSGDSVELRRGSGTAA